MASFGYSFAGLVRDFLRLAPVGHVIITTNPDNPNTYGYRGTWELIQPDNTLRATSPTSATGDLGKYGGSSNTPVVPVPQHSHSASFHGNRMPDHYHYSAESSWNSAYVYSGKGGAGVGNRHGLSGNTSNKYASAGTPTGSITVNNTGTANATIDTRGKYFAVLMWHRTA